MSFLGFLRKKKRKQNIEPIQTPEVIEEGIEQAVRKKQRERRDMEQPEEIVLADYEPKIPLEERNEKEEMLPTIRNEEEGIQLLIENCEQISELEKHNENAKIEYQAVTEYLSDVQKIQRMESKEKTLLEDAARAVMDLTKQRENYQKKEVHTTNACFRSIRQYDGSLMEELKKMREHEEYDKKVKNDMRHLEAEKAALKYEYKELFKKQKELKQLSIATSILVVSLFFLFYVLAQGLKRSMTMPYMLTVVMAAAVAGYIFFEGYRNRYSHVVIEQKLNRAILLLNKVKIKYINNTSTLEYSYSKYNVKNSMELAYLIKEYTKAKELERSYQTNTDRLTHYRDKVLDILQFHDVADAEIWLHQLTALLEKEEFEEVKTSLEQRRKRLVEKMDANIQLKDDCFHNMHCVLENYPNLKTQLVQLLEQYHIVL